jgi:hypothetical protein
MGGGRGRVYRGIIASGWKSTCQWLGHQLVVSIIMLWGRVVDK